MNEETKQKISKSLKSYFTSKRAKKQVSDEVKRRWRKTAYRKKVIRGIKNKYKEKGYLEDMREKWESPENRAKIVMRIALGRL